jgi:YD repeat-containing protein
LEATSGPNSGDILKPPEDVMKPEKYRATRYYRALLGLLPFDFRSDFGPEMEQVFSEQRAEAARDGGKMGMWRLWWETLKGIFTTAPREHLSMLWQDSGFALRMMRKNLGFTIAAKTTYAYDDADRLTTMTDAATPGNVTTYGYDTESNLTSIQDANNHTTSFTYDAFGRVTKTTFPSGYIETYGYDANNNLTGKTDRKNQQITYTYDQLNRLTQKTYPDSNCLARRDS